MKWKKVCWLCLLFFIFKKRLFDLKMIYLVNGIEMMSTAAPAELANTTLLVAQHGAFLMGHPEIK